MPVTQSPLPADTIKDHAARRSLSALQDALATIDTMNADPALRPLIAKSLSHCAQLDQYFARLLVTPPETEKIVDMQVFERLMMLAGPNTMPELLDQLLLDLKSAKSAIATAAPQLDWQSLRNQCHILIAVAGSIGATAVLRNSERLQTAAHAEDAAGTGPEAKALLARLQTLIAFVQRERHARVGT
jgi:HPt (histidine-containing phosphotransfer) domain-containing protein